MKTCIAFLSVALLLPVLASGQNAKRHDPIRALVYPPELVMNNQAAIELSGDQRREISGELSTAQGDFISLKFELAGLSEQLEAQLSSAHVDEGAALEIARAMMDLESQIKSRHLSLAIRIKNLLSAEQQGKLDLIRNHLD